MVDYHNMGPSLQLVGAQTSEFTKCRYYRTFKGPYFPTAWG